MPSSENIYITLLRSILLWSAILGVYHLLYDTEPQDTSLVWGLETIIMLLFLVVSIMYKEKVDLTREMHAAVKEATDAGIDAQKEASLALAKALNATRKETATLKRLNDARIEIHELRSENHELSMDLLMAREYL